MDGYGHLMAGFLLFCLVTSFVDTSFRDLAKDIKKRFRKHKDIGVTYFERRDQDGKYIDQNSPAYGQETKGPFQNNDLLDQSGEIELVVSPSIVENGAVVKVVWLGVLNATSNDWIGFYCPLEDQASHYLDYLKVSASETWKEGHGFFKVSVYNMRTACCFRYYRNMGDKGSSLLATSNTLTFHGGQGTPMHGHISLTGNKTQMRVMWNSGPVLKPLVKFGLSSSSLTSNAIGTGKTYLAEEMCGPPASTTGYWDPGFIQDALLENLKPKTRYYYSFGSEQGMSPVYTFKTAIPAGDATPFKFIVYGDMGVTGYPGSATLAKLLKTEITENDVEFIFHNGDISYAEGRAYIWDKWFPLIEPYATLAPYMVSIGNHEQDHVTGGTKDPSKAPKVGFHPLWGNYLDDSHGECGVPMFYRFHMPDNGNYLWWYSFDYGLLHFVVMSTEHDFRPGSRQYKWIEKDLTNIDRSKTPWVVIAGHRAMYSSEGLFLDYVVSVHMQEYMEDLIMKYKVDLAFWAHYHSYERICKVYKGECGDKGVTHMVIGSAGVGLDDAFWFKKKWSVYREYNYGYGRFSVVNATSMYFEFVRNKDLKNYG